MTHGPISCTKFLVRETCTRNLDRLPSALHYKRANMKHAIVLYHKRVIYVYFYFFPKTNAFMNVLGCPTIPGKLFYCCASLTAARATMSRLKHERLRDLLIGVDLAGLLGGRMASAEGGSVPSGVGYGEGCPLSSRRGLGERRELHQGPGQSPGRKRILAYFEGHRTLIFVPI